jgi:hypothetical protein
MRQFSISIEIHAPSERVWEVMSDIERWHEWTPSVTSIRRLGRGPLAVGSRAIIRQPKFPPAMWKITAFAPGQGFTWVSVGPGIKVVGRHAVEPKGSASQATLSLELQGLFGGLFGRLTKDITERYLAFEAAGLRARSEDPHFGDGAVPPSAG